MENVIFMSRLFFKQTAPFLLSKIQLLTHRAAAAGVMDPVDQRVKPVEVELNRNLQTYLQRLGLLPKTSSASSLSPPGKVRASWMLRWPLLGLLNILYWLKYNQSFN